MMFANLVSFAAVLIRLAFGASIRTLPIAPSCPRTNGGLRAPAHFECTTSIDWVGDGYNNEDCRAAVQRLYNVEVTKHGYAEFEFLLPGAIPYTSNPVMQTPRRYTVGKCTLAIVMMDFFPPGSLPGQDPFHHHVFADTDLSSFQKIWLAADLIEICCLQSQHTPGWALVGERDSLGVFIWTVNSAEDREVPQGPPTLSLESNLTRLLNSVNESNSI
ncbi:MAG: hypothetical protein ASARMPREDX12_006535 [Alectoria sarmentosa]|nr:MAG: hypothetical protein ASARMPREDX12_006535 [Alectoria sarmentosa]